MYYILKDKQPVKVSYDEYLKQNISDDIIAKDNFGTTIISTVFVGVYNCMFETMVFGNPDLEGYQARYSTYEESVKGHQMIKECIEKLL